MYRPALFLSLALLLCPSVLSGQAYSSSLNTVASDLSGEGSGGQAASPVRGSMGSERPFSRLALGVGGSTLGIGLQAATNLNRYANLRLTGSVFQYTVSNISTNGFTVSATPSLASAGASVDLYPFRKFAFRLSPGVLFYNNNSATGTFAVNGTTSFSLDNVTYYASSTNPIVGTGSLGLHTQNPGFTITTGWGNMIPRRGGHWSFPLELGVALIGAPTLNIALTSGQACNAQGQNCVNVATDPGVQSNLAAQVTKYTSDLNPLKTYPIFSTGVAYSFKLR